MSFTRHVGKVGDRKVAVVFREVPGEPHMCLVVYTETINQHIHQALINCIDSDIGQHSENLADALNRSYTIEGKPILGVLHYEGQLKKVQTSLVIMTPNPTTSIKLDELNVMLNEMKQGEAAVKKMADMDKSRGMQDPADIIRRMRGPVEGNADVLGDVGLAKQRMDQSLKMAAEARGLLAEADRLSGEAMSLDPSLAPKNTIVKRKYIRKAMPADVS